MDDWDDPIAATTDDTTADDVPAPGDGSAEAPNDDERAVRRYLAFVEDPSTARDEIRVADLEAKIAAADDPIEKIHLASDLHRARLVDGENLRRDFIAVARRWADAQGIVPEAFRTLGVPDADLKAAGFDVGRTGRRRSEVGTVPTSPSRTRAPRATTDDIRAAARSFDQPFTIADLRDRAGGSPGTVRKALDEMVSEGLVTALGSTPGWTGPGRPPHRFEVTADAALT
jgi:hypothetical protein